MGIWFSVPGAIWKALCLIIGMSRWCTMATWNIVLVKGGNSGRTLLRTPSVLHCPRRNNRSQRTRYQTIQRIHCPCQSWRPSWRFQTSSSSQCQGLRGWRWKERVFVFSGTFLVMSSCQDVNVSDMSDRYIYLQYSSVVWPSIWVLDTYTHRISNMNLSWKSAYF